MSKAKDAPFYYVLVQPEGKGEASRIDTTDTVLSLSYEDGEKKANQLVLEVDNWDLSNFDNPIWKTGNTVIVTWGYPGFMAPQRQAVIQKVKGSTKLHITALAKSILMNKVTKSKTYENTTRSEVVHAIAKEYGYGDAQRDVEETSTVHETITQARMTDAQFIKKLADAEHFEFYVDFDGLHWHARRLGKKPLRVLQYYLPPDVGDIIEFDVENDIFAKPAAVTTKGRDPVKKADVGGEASNGKTERDALSPVPEMVDEATGSITQQKQSVSADTRPTTETSKDQAKKEADGAFKRSLLTNVKLKIDMVGDPGIVAKSVVEVRGISKRLSGLYYVNRATHKIDSGGYKLELHCSTDGTRGHSENLIPANAGGGGSSAATPAALEACKKQAAAKSSELASAIIEADKKRLTSELGAINARCKAIEAAISKATPNQGAGGTKDPNASTPKERFDQVTGKEVIEYHPDGQDQTKK
jgi:phage protein D